MKKLLLSLFLLSATMQGAETEKKYDLFATSKEREVEHSKTEANLLSEIVVLKIASGKFSAKDGEERLKRIKLVHQTLLDRWAALEAKKKELKRGDFYYYRNSSDALDSGFALVVEGQIIYQVVF